MSRSKCIRATTNTSTTSTRCTEGTIFNVHVHIKTTFKINLVASLVPGTVVDNVGHEVVGGALLVVGLVLQYHTKWKKSQLRNQCRSHSRNT